MSAFLSDEWIEEVRGVLADLPDADGVDAIVQYAISGAPDGKVQLQVVLESGRITLLERGKHPDPQCTVSLGYEDAVALFQGDLRPEVAFMSGQVKVEGDHRVWLLDLRPIRHREELAAALATLRSTTSA